MENEFYRRFSIYPDEKLLEIISDQSGSYTALATIAAAQLLKERNVEVDLPETEPSDLQDLNLIEEEIQQRLAGGENISDIQLDLKNRNIDTFDFINRQEEKANEISGKKGPWFGQSVSILFAIVCIINFLFRTAMFADTKSGWHLFGMLTSGGLAVLFIRQFFKARKAAKIKEAAE